MKRTSYILGGILAVFLLVALVTNLLMTRIIKSELDKTFAQLDSVSVSMGELQIRLLRSEIAVHDFCYMSHPGSEQDTTRISERIEVEEVRLRGIVWRRLLRSRNRCLEIKSLHIRHPRAVVYYDERQQEHPQEENDKKLAQAIAMTKILIDAAQIDEICIEEASTQLHCLSNQMTIGIDSVCLLLHDIGYNIADTLPLYNDSVYSLSVGRFTLLTPDGLTAIEAHDIRTENKGGLEVGRTHIRNTVDKWEFVHTQGDVPSSWIDLTIQHIRTSPLSPVELATEKFYSLDKLEAEVEHMHVFHDKRYPPKDLYRMPQEAIMGLNLPFVVKLIDARVRTIFVEIAFTDENVGAIQIDHIQATIPQLRIRPDQAIRAHIIGELGEGSKATLDFTMHLNKACEWEVALRGSDIEMENLNDLLYPIVGMKVSSTVDSVRAVYHGNATKAEGTFCLAYSDLVIHADKDAKPAFAIVSKMAGAINGFADGFIPKSNPGKLDKVPRSYRVSWKNDPTKEVALFFVGPIINGVVETFLPGLFLCRMEKAPKTAKKQ